jgi:hypothetical protein
MPGHLLRPRAVVLIALVAMCVAVLRAEPEEAFFKNTSTAFGLDKFSAKRVNFADLDGDGWLDIFILDDSKKDLHVMLNKPAEGGGRRLVDSTEASGLKKAAGERFPNFIIFGDVDNDGDADAFLSRYNDFEKPGATDDELRCEILLNDGKGVFMVLEKSGVADRSETICAAAFLDYDNDGLLDLFTGNWYRIYGELQCHPDRLYRGKGDGHFEEVTEKLGLMTAAEPGKRNSSRPTYGVTHLDYNNDGWQDILVCAYGRQWNMLWKNEGGKKFVEVGEETGIDGDADRSGKYPQSTREMFKERYGSEREDEMPFRSNGNTFDAACEDFDNDGDVDVFLGEICHSWAGSSSDRSMLCDNLGRDKGFAFKRRPEAIERKHASPENWNEGDLHVGWLDFDNDGRLDLLIASSDYPDGQYLKLFRQKEDGSFKDITDKCGFDWEGCGGVSLGDFDRDGDVDILVGRSLARLPKEKTEGKVPHAALFENRIGSRNSYLCVMLQGSGKDCSSRSAIGARVSVKADGVVQMRELRGGAGHCGHQNPPEAYFGLGKAKKVEYVEVRWPDRKLSIQKFIDIPVNSYIRVTEGKAQVETVSFK